MSPNKNFLDSYRDRWSTTRRFLSKKVAPYWMGFLSLGCLLLLIGTGFSVFANRAGAGMLATIFVLIVTLVVAALVLGLGLWIVYYLGAIFAILVAWTWCFSMTLWDASAVIRRLFLAPYYRRKEAREAARLLKIQIALEAKIDSVRTAWKDLQNRITKTEAEFSAEKISVELFREFEAFRDQCRETVSGLISAEKWDEAGTTIQRLSAELDRIVAKRIELSAKINFIRTAWEDLQNKIAKADAEFSAEHINFELFREFEDLRSRCRETIPGLISAEKWNEAETAIQRLSTELDRVVGKRVELRAKIPQLRTRWNSILSHSSRLIEEARMLELPRTAVADLQELVNVILQHGQAQLDEEDWEGLEMTLAAADEGLAEHDHLSRVLSELGLERDSLSKSTLSTAYKRMAKRYHPDLGASGCHERMVRINEAKQLLEAFLTFKSKVA